MKYLFTLLLFLFSFGSSTATAQGSVTIAKTSYNQWFTCQEVGNGKPSFFSIISTDWMKYNGYYYFDVYLHTNSFYRNGNQCSTYINDIYLYVWENGEWNQVFYSDWVLLTPPSGVFNGNVHFAYIYDTKYVQKIKIKWGETYIY